MARIVKLPDTYLSRREQQLIEILYREGPRSATEVVALLPDSPSNQTVRKLLGILEEKGHVRHEEVDGKFVYSPTHPKELAGKNVLRDAVQTFFAGSMANTVAALLTDGQKLSHAELSHIESLIAKAKEEQR
jgi:predicted transcriptional regulator